MWRGFIRESKSFMSYDTMTRREKLRFWLRVPRAWLKFKMLDWRYG